MAPLSVTSAIAAGAAECLDVTVVRTAEACRYQAVERRAEHALARHAEELLGRSVEKHDALLFVHGDHRVHRRIDDGPEAQVRLAESTTHPLGLELGLPAQRDVAQDDGVVAPSALGCQRYRGLERELIAVGAQAPQHGGVAHAPARDSRAPELLDVAPVRGPVALGNKA